MLMAGALDGHHLFVLVVLCISSLLNLVYLGEIILRGFFVPARAENAGGYSEAPLAVLIPLVITAIISLMLFFSVDIFILDFTG
jgi:multicomponent Na+:H+ antiporter subunit D